MNLLFMYTFDQKLNENTLNLKIEGKTLASNKIKRNNNDLHLYTNVISNNTVKLKKVKNTLIKQ